MALRCNFGARRMRRLRTLADLECRPCRHGLTLNRVAPAGCG
jgi:hypothetical protein